jgi:hypothetical protein
MAFFDRPGDIAKQSGLLTEQSDNNDDRRATASNFLCVVCADQVPARSFDVVCRYVGDRNVSDNTVLQETLCADVCRLDSRESRCDQLLDHIH